MEGLPEVTGRVKFGGKRVEETGTCRLRAEIVWFLSVLYLHQALSVDSCFTDLKSLYFFRIRLSNSNVR